MITNALLAVLIAYLLGSIPTGYLVGRRLKGVDIREVGDRYMGAKNVFQEIGLGAAIITVAVDVAKGAVAMLLPKVLPVPDAVLILVAIAAVAGHIWPVYIRFRDGAGLATTLGIVFAVLPRETLILLIPFVALALTVGRRVALGLACALLLVPLILLSWWLGEPTELIVLPLVLGALVSARVYRHQIGEVLGLGGRYRRC